DVVDVVAGRLVVAVGVGAGGLRRGDDHPAAGTACRAATVAAIVSDADQTAAAVATVAAGSTATAGVDVTDLGVLAAAGVGGDVAARLGVDVVAAVIDVVVDAARVDVG